MPHMPLSIHSIIILLQYVLTTYGLDDVLYYYKHHLVPHNNDLTVSVFDVERMLSKMKPSSPVADAVPTTKVVTITVPMNYR